MKHDNIWAPWRIEYLRTLDDEPSVSGDECFLCRYWKCPAEDKKNLVLWRTDRCMVIFNRFPYTGGHMLVAPFSHVGGLGDLDNATMLEMMCLARDVQSVLVETIGPGGFNVGININHCAGAGLPGHLHLHVVPRWEGDTNFMAVTGQVRVISQGLDDLYDEMTDAAGRLGLPLK